MLTFLDFTNIDDFHVYQERMPRASFDISRALESASSLINDVRERGEKALIDAALRFDHCEIQHVRVSPEAISHALDTLDPALREALEMSIEHNRLGHSAQLPQNIITRVVPGGLIHQRWIPVHRVGVYVPGGLAVYPSSVIMNVIAAQVAGVKHIALASPAQEAFGGLPHPTILACCGLLGISEVYAVGGASAIGMFAYGARANEQPDSPVVCEKVQVITGPGNIYVAAAKRLVHGVVGIDAEAGPTEIGIIADEHANPEYVAADLLSQAEHDPNAASVLISPSRELIERVDEVLTRRAEHTKHRERVHTALTGKQSASILVRDLDQAIDVANAYGAEHLEIQCEDYRAVTEKITNAGAIFLGSYSPVPLGDYIAGSNHVLPTGGTSAFASGLNVHSFIKSVQEIEYTQEAMTKLVDPLTLIAHDEDLPAHAQALHARLEY